MAISTPGTPLNTTVKTDKWICTQWVLYKRIKKNLQKVTGTRCPPCTSSCSTIQAGAARNRQEQPEEEQGCKQTRRAQLPSCTKESDPLRNRTPPTLTTGSGTCYTLHNLLRLCMKGERWFWEQRQKWDFTLSCFVFLKPMDQNNFFIKHNSMFLCLYFF